MAPRVQDWRSQIYCCMPGCTAWHAHESACAAPCATPPAASNAAGHFCNLGQPGHGPQGPGLEKSDLLLHAGLHRTAHARVFMCGPLCYSACGLTAAGHFCTLGPGTRRHTPQFNISHYCCVPGCTAWHALMPPLRPEHGSHATGSDQRIRPCCRKPQHHWPARAWECIFILLPSACQRQKDSLPCSLACGGTRIKLRLLVQ